MNARERGPDVDELRRRIDEVEEDIHAARERVAAHDDPDHDDGAIHWHESGDIHPEWDDPQIAPG